MPVVVLLVGIASSASRSASFGAVRLFLLLWLSSAMSVRSTAASAWGAECRRRFPPEEVSGQVIGKPLLVLVVMVVGPAWEGVVIVGLS